LSTNNTLRRYTYSARFPSLPSRVNRFLESVTTRDTDEEFEFAENHAMSDEDRALFERLNIGAGTTTIIPHDKVVVNKGETMRTETIVHHVHRELPASFS